MKPTTLEDVEFQLARVRALGGESAVRAVRTAALQLPDHTHSRHGAVVAACEEWHARRLENIRKLDALLAQCGDDPSSDPEIRRLAAKIGWGPREVEPRYLALRKI